MYPIPSHESLPLALGFFIYVQTKHSRQSILDNTIVIYYFFRFRKFNINQEKYQMTTELKAPTGKTRVIDVDLFDHGNYLVDDYDDQDEAFRITDEHNSKRSDPMDDVYYAYDDTGRHVRSNENVDGPGVSP